MKFEAILRVHLPSGFHSCKPAYICARSVLILTCYLTEGRPSPVYIQPLYMGFAWLPLSFPRSQIPLMILFVFCIVYHLSGLVIFQNSLAAYIRKLFDIFLSLSDLPYPTQPIFLHALQMFMSRVSYTSMSLHVHDHYPRESYHHLSLRLQQWSTI